MSYHTLALLLRTIGVMVAVGASMVAIWLAQKSGNAKGSKIVAGVGDSRRRRQRWLTSPERLPIPPRSDKTARAEPR